MKEKQSNSNSLNPAIAQWLKMTKPEDIFQVYFDIREGKQTGELQLIEDWLRSNTLKNIAIAWMMQLPDAAENSKVIEAAVNNPGVTEIFELAGKLHSIVFNKIN